MKFTNPIFLQAASNVGEVFAGIKMMFNIDDPEITSLTGTGDIVVTSTKNGQVVTETYTDPTTLALSIEADANTEIMLSGNILDFSMEENGNIIKAEMLGSSVVGALLNDCSSLSTLVVSNCKDLVTLNCGATKLSSATLVNCPNMERFTCSYCDTITDIDLSKCANITRFGVSKNSALRKVNLSQAANITEIYFEENNSIVEIRFRATAQKPSTNIAAAITAATSTTGTVYLNSADPYYSIVADAATAKGWTVAEL